MRTKVVKLGSAMIAALAMTATGCGKSTSFSLLSDSANFQQNTASINGKIDILFVIDNSGSMASSQQALADNISRFFDKFDAKGFDYQFAVTTTDAWRVGFGGATTLAQYRDGTNSTGHTGQFIVTPLTADRQNVFIKNMKQGTSGNGDERAFQSIEETLKSSLNSQYNFPRADAFFSVVMLSDADDLSNTTASTIDTAPSNAMYSNANIVPVQHTIDFLDQKFGVVNGQRSSKYNVNTIGVLDQACINQTAGGENKIANRMKQLSDATGGITGSLCGDFGTTLSDISYKIIQLSTRFYLTRSIVVDTLRVFVDGVEIPRITNSSGDGFMYNSDDNSISFFGSAVPGPGSSISVSYDPTEIK